MQFDRGAMQFEYYLKLDFFICQMDKAYKLFIAIFTKYSGTLSYGFYPGLLKISKNHSFSLFFGYV